MIARDHNRAALIIYSVANETPISDARNHFLRQLIQKRVQSTAPGLLSAALQAREVADGKHITIHINDPIGSDLDVIGNNEYIGWYVRRPEDADSIDWISEFDKPLIMSEFGAMHSLATMAIRSHVGTRNIRRISTSIRLLC